MRITTRTRLILVGKSVLLGLLASTTVLAATTIGTDIATDGRIDAPAHAAAAGLNLPTNAGTPSSVIGTAEGDIVWNTTGDALYVYNGSAFQQVGATPTTSLNQAYLNSTSTTELYLTPSQGAFTIADTFSGTGNIFEIQDRTNPAGDYSRRYLTVSSTGTTVTDLIVTGSCTGCSTVTNSNQAYLAATGSPEISITPSIGAFTIADTFSGTGNIFEIQDRTNPAGDYSQRYLTVSATAVGLFSNDPTGTLTVHRADALSGYVLMVQSGNSNIFTVDYQGNIVGDRSLNISRSTTLASGADEYWDFPALTIAPSAAFTRDLIQAKTGATVRLVVKASGYVGIMTDSPSAELDVRDTEPVPTTNIFQVADLNDSTRYLTVSSTATTIANLTVGAGTPITKHLSGTATNLVSASISAVSCGSYGTIAVTGAAVGDTVYASPDAASSASGVEDSNLMWSAVITSANTVTIRACNPTALAIDAGDDQEWRADVWQH